MRNTNKIRRLLSLAIVLAGLTLTIAIFLKVHKKKQVTPSPPTQFPAADISLRKIHYVEARKGKKIWDLFADRADYDKKSDTTRLARIKFIVVGEKGTGDVELVADNAEYAHGSGDVSLSGNVKASSDSGLKFAAPAVSYDAAKSTINSSAHVSFTDGMLSVEGVGMELSTDRRSMEIKHDVHATFLPERLKTP